MLYFSSRSIRFARSLLFASIAILSLSAAGGPARAAAIAPERVPFAERTMTVGNVAYKYAVFIPRRLNLRKKTPVILFLHGIGERGDDGLLQTKNGIRLLIARDPDAFPAVVICPQLHPETRWSQPAVEELTLKMLDQCMAEFNGDPRRVYLTGLSLGGYGTWEMARRYPRRWAAIAPVCGGVVYPAWVGADISETTATERDPYYASALADAGIPAWDFHGEADATVPVSESRQLVAALLALKSEVKYSEYPGVGHDSWNNAYAEPELLEWLLSHKRPR